MRMFVQNTLTLLLRLALFCGFGWVGLSTAHTSQTPSTPQPAFAPSYFVIEQQKVGFEIHSNGLVVQTIKGETAIRVKGTIQNTLTNALPTMAARVSSVSALTQTGLYRVGFGQSLASHHLEKLASVLREQPNIQQVYPVLRRGSGQAYTDQHLVVTALPQQLPSVLRALEKRLEIKGTQTSRVPDTAILRLGARHGHDAVRVSRMLFEQHKIPGLRSAEPLLYRDIQTHDADGGISALPDRDPPPMLKDQWHLARQAEQDIPGTGEIFADDAWDITRGNIDIVIAIFDTGIDIGHPLLASNRVGGFDAIDNDTDPSAECSTRENGRDKAASCPENKPFRETHGTAVSGLAVASGGEGDEVSGVCPECGFMPVRFIASETARSLSFAEAIVRAVDEGADVINNSWGPRYSRFFPLSTAEIDAFRYAHEQGRGGLGTLIFFSAGNSAMDILGNAYVRSPYTVSVGASSCLDDWAPYSSFGAEMDMVTPSKGGATDDDSHGVVSTDVLGDDGYTEGDFTSDFSGTSASSPIAAGLAGLILSANPNLTADQVRVIMTSTADKINADQIDWVAERGQDRATEFAYDDVGHSIGFGFGRVHAYHAVLAALLPSPQGGFCDAPGCPHCGDNNRCELECTSQADCLDGTRCEGGFCVSVHGTAPRIGAPCDENCDHCLTTLGTSYESIDICTEFCEERTDCPSGFSCRLLSADGIRVCAPSLINAGEPADLNRCRDPEKDLSMVVQGDDGMTYCTDLCGFWEEGACPYGFYCANAHCSCVASEDYHCTEYLCEETETLTESYNPTAMCFPEPTFRGECTLQDDCPLGEYCNQEGLCVWDDRAGCEACQLCSSDEACGVRGICWGKTRKYDGVCTVLCAPPNYTCPGNSMCREIIKEGESHFLCLSPNPEETPELSKAIIRVHLGEVVGNPAGPCTLWHNPTDNQPGGQEADYQNTNYVPLAQNLFEPTDAPRAYYEIDVTEQILQDYAQDTGNIISGFRLQITEATLSSQDGAYGIAAGDLRPQLEVTYTHSRTLLARKSKLLIDDLDDGLTEGISRQVLNLGASALVGKTTAEEGGPQLSRLLMNFKLPQLADLPEATCAPQWQCEVTCREDAPCPEGFECVSGECEELPLEEVVTEDISSGCDCSSNNASPLPLALLMLLFVLRKSKSSKGFGEF